MSSTHSLGKIFVHGQRLDKEAPRHDPVPVYEIEYPFHIATSHVFRIFGKLGFGVGWWEDNPGDIRDPQVVQRHLLDALKCADGGARYSIESHTRFMVQEVQKQLGLSDVHEFGQEHYLT